MTLLAVLLPLPLPNCSLRVCLPTIFASVLKFFLPPTTSAISDAAISNKSAPTCFAAGTLDSQKNGIPVLPITCARALNPHPRWSNHLVPSFRLEINVGGFSEHQNKTSDADRYYAYLFTARVSRVNVNSMNRIFEQRFEWQFAKYVIVHVLSSS